jgi:catechol 2,3-dioxygenase-like lactoylglutathione lyase family enzyme
MSGVRVEGINHTTLAVSDLARSFAFYTEVLDLRAVARWDGGAYLVAGEDWVVLIADPATRKGPLPEYTHLAFSVPTGRVGEAQDLLLGAGVEVWQENSTEGDSLYFLDPDGHKLEIHASNLERRLQADRRNPPPGMCFFD